MSNPSFSSISLTSQFCVVTALPLSQLPREDNYVLVEQCRKCSGRYEFKIDGSNPINILCGRPESLDYKAVSYLWEDVSPLSLDCHHCSAITSIPLRDLKKLTSLLNLSSGMTVWLDALSIDQDNPADLVAQLSIMGDIYRRAKTVSVLMPQSDGEAYHSLKELGSTADAVVKHHKHFAESLYGTTVENSVPKDVLTRLANRYWTEVSELAEKLPKWRYWQRAWTFQEWTMASELEIFWEGSANGESLSNIKNVIVMASSILGHWETMSARQAAAGTAQELPIELVNVRDRVGKRLNLVRAMFPFEGFLVADDGEISEDMRTRTFLTAMPSAIDSGTYVGPSSESNSNLHLRSTLSLALNAINITERNARYEADQVACWASMCNITYDYNKNETVAEALHEVIFVLRSRGITIYNFLVNTDAAETDLGFFKYAAAHRQSNATSAGYMFGNPIFTGRADTVSHIRNIIAQKGDIIKLGSHREITLREVANVAVKCREPLSHTASAVSAFRSMISGKFDGERLTDVGDQVEQLLKTSSSHQLEKHLLVTVSLSVTDVDTISHFNAWAICPSNPLPTSNLFVARESLNGTLVLAQRTDQDQDPKPKTPSPSSSSSSKEHVTILAYLNMTNQKDGTYLVKSQEDGTLDIVFRTADNMQDELSELLDLSALTGLGSLGGWSFMDMLDDRAFGMHITLY